MKFRKALKITSRTSSVTNGFVQAIIPCIEPTADELAEALSVLGMRPGSETCVYCGSVASDWDHLRPLVRGKRPTGYANEIGNLVPACGRCNQSKGGQDWRDWMNGCASGSPRTRGITDLDQRIAVLERFEGWAARPPLDFRSIVGEPTWAAYWERLEAIESQMHEAQKEALAIKRQIHAELEARRA